MLNVTTPGVDKFSELPTNLENFLRHDHHIKISPQPEDFAQVGPLVQQCPLAYFIIKESRAKPRTHGVLQLEQDLVSAKQREVTVLGDHYVSQAGHVEEGEL